jgi:hypothetical protein
MTKETGDKAHDIVETKEEHVPRWGNCHLHQVLSQSVRSGLKSSHLPLWNLLVTLLRRRMGGEGKVKSE